MRFWYPAQLETALEEISKIIKKRYTLISLTEANPTYLSKFKNPVKVIQQLSEQIMMFLVLGKDFSSN